MLALPESLALQFGKEFVEALGRGGEGAGGGVERGLVHRLRKGSARRGAEERKGQGKCSKHEKAHGGYGKPPWRYVKSIFVDHHDPLTGERPRRPISPDEP